jgi:hypothetical protein
MAIRLLIIRQEFFVTINNVLDHEVAADTPTLGTKIADSADQLKDKA